MSGAPRHYGNTNTAMKKWDPSKRALIQRDKILSSSLIMKLLASFQPVVTCLTSTYLEIHFWSQGIGSTILRAIWPPGSGFIIWISFSSSVVVLVQMYKTHCCSPRTFLQLCAPLLLPGSATHTNTCYFSSAFSTLSAGCLGLFFLFDPFAGRFFPFWAPRIHSLCCIWYFIEEGQRILYRL